MSKAINYEDDVKIDPDALDVEWLRQSELMGIYGKHQAQTRNEMDNAKELIDVTKAKLDFAIRNDPEKYGLAKVTESAIQSAILLQEEYRENNEAYANARYENDVALSVVRAIEQKKTALENLVRLLQSSYFSGPKAPRDLSAEVLKEKERKNANQKVKIKRRRVGNDE